MRQKDIERQKHNMELAKTLASRKEESAELMHDIEERAQAEGFRQDQIATKVPESTRKVIDSKMEELDAFYHDGGRGMTGKFIAGTFSTPLDIGLTPASRGYGMEIHWFGDDANVTGLRSRAQLRTSEASTRTAQGALIQAANNNGISAGVLNGALIEAIGKSDISASTITMMRGALINTEWNAKETITDLRILHVRTHTRNASTEGYISGTSYGIYIENEAVGGNGQVLDAGIYLKQTNISGGNKAFTYGIDFTGAQNYISTADIRLQYGETIKNTTDGLVEISGILETAMRDGGGQVYNVKHSTFGAVGDGITDDTAAIQAAIDTAEADWQRFVALQQWVGPTVFFPSGAYKVTGLTVHKHVNLVGAGKWSAILYSETNRPIIDIALPHVDNDPHIKDNQMIVEKLSLVGNVSTSSSPAAKPDMHGIRFTGDCVVIRDVRAVKCGGHGLYLASGITSRVEDCTLTNMFDGYGLLATSQVSRFNVSAAANGGPRDGYAVELSGGSKTGTCKRYAPLALNDTAGDIELYNLGGVAWDDGDVVQETAAGDPTRTVTITCDRDYYEAYRGTSLTVRDCTVRYNVKGIEIAGTRSSIVRDCLIESNIRGTGAHYGAVTKPAIGLEFSNRYRTGTAGHHLAIGNYFENNMCDIYFNSGKNRAAFNRHHVLVANDGDPSVVTKSTCVWIGSARTTIIGEHFSAGTDGVIYADDEEICLYGCWWGDASAAVRRRIEFADIGGSAASYRYGVGVIDFSEDEKLADSRWTRIHRGPFWSHMMSVENTPLAVWSLAVNGGIIQYGDGWDAPTVRYGSAIPTTGNWIRGDRIIYDSPSPGGMIGWVCVESGTFETIAETGDPANGSDEVSDISGYTNLGIGTFIDIAGVTGTFMVTDRDTVADTITLDDDADATLDDAAITNHDPVFLSFGYMADATNYFDLEPDGEVRLYGTARVRKHLFIGAVSWHRGSSAPDDSDIGIFHTIAFDSTSDDEVHYTLLIPHDHVTGSEIDIDLDWAYTGGDDNGTVCWVIEYKSVAPNEAIVGGTTPTSETTAGNHTSGNLNRETFTIGITGAVGHEAFALHLYRDVSEDTMSADAELIAVHLSYLSDKLGEAT